MPPKKATNLSINSDLLKKIKSLNINLSATVENSLKELLLKKEKDIWKLENKKAIASYNDFIEEHGCFSDEFRSF